MRRLVPYLLVAFVIAGFGFTTWQMVSVQIAEQRQEKERRAKNEESIRKFTADIDIVQAMIDPLNPNDDAQACIWRAKESLTRAECANINDAFICRFSLSTTRFWLRMALKDLGRGTEMLSDWQD